MASLKEILNRMKVERGCVDCKEHYPKQPFLLEWDHVRGIKALEVSQARNLSEALEEIEKCEVRCVICHRIRHRTKDTRTQEDAYLEQDRLYAEPAPTQKRLHDLRHPYNTTLKKFCSAAEIQLAGFRGQSAPKIRCIPTHQDRLVKAYGDNDGGIQFYFCPEEFWNLTQWLSQLSLGPWAHIKDCPVAVEDRFIAKWDIKPYGFTKQAWLIKEELENSSNQRTKERKEPENHA